MRVASGDGQIAKDSLAMSSIHRLWPQPSAEPLDDDALLDAYRPGDHVLRVNFVESADGAVTVAGRSGALGGPADKRVFDLLRVQCDAVMVGAGTLRTEGYGPMVVDPEHQRLRSDAGRTPNPVLIVVSGALDLDPAHPMFVEAPQRPWVLTHAGSPEDRRDALADVASVLVCGTSAVDFAEATGMLADAALRQILCEGGPHLFGSLVAANVLDELCLTVAPKLAGAGAGRIISGPLAELRDVDLAHVLRSEAGELFLRYARIPES